MRSSDFRERLNGIEEFQKLCELETDTAIQCTCTNIRRF